MTVMPRSIMMSLLRSISMFLWILQWHEWSDNTVGTLVHLFWIKEKIDWRSLIQSHLEQTHTLDYHQKKKRKKNCSPLEHDNLLLLGPVRLWCDCAKETHDPAQQCGSSLLLKTRWRSSIWLPVVHKGDCISDCEASWDPSIFKKLNPLGGGLRKGGEKTISNWTTKMILWNTVIISLSNYHNPITKGYIFSTSLIRV